jgi:hypothetical protein
MRAIQACRQDPKSLQPYRVTAIQLNDSSVTSRFPLPMAVTQAILAEELIAQQERRAGSLPIKR